MINQVIPSILEHRSINPFLLEAIRIDVAVVHCQEQRYQNEESNQDMKQGDREKVPALEFAVVRFNRCLR